MRFEEGLKRWSDYCNLQINGGRYHVRGENILSLSDWTPERMIVIEFENEDQIQKWLTSPEYAVIAPLREQGADFFVVQV